MKEFYKELKKEDYYRAVLTDEDDILNAIGKFKERLSKSDEHGI